MAILASLIIPLIVLGFVLFVLFLYINSIMRFILFDSIIAKECHIRQGWVRRRHNGRRFFVWQLVLMLLSLAAFMLLVGIPVLIAWGRVGSFIQANTWRRSFSAASFCSCSLLSWP